MLAHSTFVNHGGSEGRFVHLWADRLLGPTPVRMANNLFVGPGELDMPVDADRGGNHRIGPQALRDATGGDYRLVPKSSLTGSAVPLPAQQTPHDEFAAPAGTRPLPPGLPLSPGALQLP